MVVIQLKSFMRDSVQSGSTTTNFRRNMKRYETSRTHWPLRTSGL